MPFHFEHKLPLGLKYRRGCSGWGCWIPLSILGFLVLLLLAALGVVR